MAAVTHGMNPDEVERLGNDLQTISANIGTLIKDIERKIGATTWVGPDSSTFKNQWWPGHRASLSKLQSELHGFGQSAKNNATEQRRVSGH